MENLDKEYDFFFDLPPELADLILSFLSHSKWRFKLRRICKKWMHWINITDFKLGLVFGNELREIADWFSKSKSSFGLNFSKATIHIIRTDQYAPLTILTNLTSLTVAHKQVSDGKDPEWISALTNLEQLELHMVTKATLTPLTKLIKLITGILTIKDYYSDEKTSYDDEIEEIELDLPFLESASFHSISATDLPPLIKDGTNLTHLSLLGFWKLQPNYLDQFVNLKTLEIKAKAVDYYDSGFKNTNLINLARILPNLESLTTNVDFIFDTILKLTYLRIDRPHGNIQNATYDSIRQLTNLRVLELNGIKDLHLDLSGLKLLSSLALRRHYDSTPKFEKILNSVNPDQLKKLMYSEDHHQDCTRILPKFSNLTDLDITIHSDQKTERDLSPVMTLTNLAKLVINGHTKWTLNGLSKLGNSLRKLSIKGADNEKSEGFEELKELTNLTDLEISLGCNNIDISGITTLESITVRGLNFNYNKEDLKYLTQLTISKPLENWTDLRYMTELQSFSLTMVPLEEPARALLELSQLKNLRFLYLPYTYWHDHLTRISQLHSFRVSGTIPYNNEKIREKIPLYTEFMFPTPASY